MLWLLIKQYAPFVLMALFLATIAHPFYNYPFCEKCRGNWRTKRINGKRLCEIHGEF